MDSENSRLKHARELKGFTLQQLAGKIGYSVGTISGIENGHDRPSKRLRDVLISALDLDPLWLETGRGETFKPSPLTTSRSVAASDSEVEKMLRQLSPNLIAEITRRVHRDCLLECDVNITENAFRRGWVEAQVRYKIPDIPGYPSKVKIQRLEPEQASSALSEAIARNHPDLILIPALPESFMKVVYPDGDRFRLLTPFCFFALVRAAVRLSFGDAAAPKILRDLSLGYWLDLLQSATGETQ